MGTTLINETTACQKAAIRAHLLEHGEIDRDTALFYYDCDALRSRISDLRHDKDDPMDIKTVWKTKKNRYGHTVNYAIYALQKDEEAIS